jgi:seryl-tRNA synthetase
MKTLALSLFLSLAGTSIYADESAKKQEIEMQLENLVLVDRQIEGLVKERIELKAKAEEKMERGADSILPREAKRAAREVEEMQGKIQEMSTKLQELENKREQILLSLQ